MTDSDSQRARAEQADPTTRLVQHLQQQPEDLIDARHLMHHFHISAEDFARGLAQLEQSSYD
jgi:hypothetical protein